MNTHIRHGIVALALLLAAGESSATITISEIFTAFTQGAGNNLTVGFRVTASTNQPSLGLAVGWTLACDSGGIPLNASHLEKASSVFGPTLTVSAPDQGSGLFPGNYAVPGWSNIPAASCTHCVLDHKFQIKDETTTEYNFGVGGLGVNFQLFPSSEISVQQPDEIDACKGGKPVCCTPGCQIP